MSVSVRRNWILTQVVDVLGAILPMALALGLIAFRNSWAGTLALSLLPLAYLWPAGWLVWRLSSRQEQRGRKLLEGLLLCAAVALVVQGLGLGVIYIFASPSSGSWNPNWRLFAYRWAVGGMGVGLLYFATWGAIEAARSGVDLVARRTAGRLHSYLTFRFTLLALLTVLLLLVLPAALLAIAVDLASPVPAQATLYARLVGQHLTQEPGDRDPERLMVYFDKLLAQEPAADLPREPSPLILERVLPPVARPEGLAWVSKDGQLRLARGGLVGLIMSRNSTTSDSSSLSIEIERALREIITSASAGQEDLLAASRIIGVGGQNPLLLGAAPVLGSDGQVQGTVVAELRIRGITSLFSPYLLFVGVALLFGRVSLVILPLALLIAVLLARRAAQRLVARVGELHTAAQVMATGDLQRRAQADNPDELGDLARQFNHMAESLAQTLSALQAEKTKVAELARSRQELVANVSHDLRTPLTLLQAHLESLEHHPEALREYLPVLRDASSRLGNLVEDLFALARLEAGELELNQVTVDLHPLISKFVLANSAFAWQQHRVVLRTEVQESLPSVLADPQRVVQILDNLLANALRYTPEGGIITVSAHDLDGQRVQVRVTDSGAGMAPEHLPHVFERFYRADPARAGNGVGLGLAIVKSLTEAMGGEVGVESTEGEGASFWFTLKSNDTHGSSSAPSRATHW